MGGRNEWSGGGLDECVEVKVGVNMSRGGLGECPLYYS